MKRAIIGAALAVWLAAPVAFAEPVELQWWHAMTSVNADRVNKIAADFNTAQTVYKIVPVFKGSYAETMNAGLLPTAPETRRTSSRSSKSVPRR